MSPLVEIRLLAQRELKRSVRSAKGVVIGAITLLGALLASVVCVWMEGKQRALSESNAQVYEEVKERAIEQAFGGTAYAQHVAKSPFSLFLFFQFSVWLLPLLIAILGFDAIAGELQHRTIRFWTVRARRWTVFAGKLVALWVLVGLIELAVNALADGVALARGYITAGELASWGIPYWLVALGIAGAWSAIATLISSLFRSPIVALLTTFAVFFAVWLISVIAFATDPGRGWYAFVYPNKFSELLLSSEPPQVIGAVAALLAYVAVVGGAGAYLLQRRDI